MSSTAKSDSKVSHKSPQMNKRTSCESPRDPGGETEVDRNGSVAHEVGMQESTGTSGEYPKMSRMMRARVDVSKCVARG